MHCWVSTWYIATLPAQEPCNILPLFYSSLVAVSLYMVPLQSSFAKPQTPTDTGNELSHSIGLCVLKVYMY